MMNKHLNQFEYGLKPSRAVFKNPLLDRGAILGRDQKIESSVDENFLAAFVPGVALETVTAAGAAAVTNYLTKLDSTSGAMAITLADGLVLGQLKKLQLTVDGGDATLTPANFSNGATITFADAGDFALLQWNGTQWVAVEVGNDADGATAPVIA